MTPQRLDTEVIQTMQTTITKQQCEAALSKLEPADASTLSYGYSLANGRTWFTVATTDFSTWEALKGQGLLTNYPTPSQRPGRRNYEFTELGHVVAIAL